MVKLWWYLAEICSSESAVNQTDDPASFIDLGNTNRLLWGYYIITSNNGYQLSRRNRNVPHCKI